MIATKKGSGKKTTPPDAKLSSAKTSGKVKLSSSTTTLITFQTVTTTKTTTTISTTTTTTSLATAPTNPSQTVAPDDYADSGATALVVLSTINIMLLVFLKFTVYLIILT